MNEIIKDGWTDIRFSYREDKNFSNEEIQKSITNAYKNYKAGLSETYVDEVNTLFSEPKI